MDDNTIVTVWMLKWAGYTDAKVASHLGVSLRDIKALIKNDESFWYQGRPSWLPDNWWERFLDHLRY